MSQGAPKFRIAGDCNFPLATDTPARLLKTARFFRDLVRRAKNEGGTGNILTSLTECERVDPGGILLLKHAAMELQAMGWLHYIQGFALGDTVYSVVKENLSHYLLPATQRKNMPQKEGDYLLRGIKSRGDMVEELGEWASSVQKGTGAEPREVSIWETQIGEVTTNSFQHGKAGTGHILIAGQANKKTGVVQLAALDLGIGIPKLIRDVVRPPGIDGDGDLIAHAFRKGVTSQCEPANQGAGLTSLARSVQQNKRGDLSVLSNNGFYRVTKMRKHAKNLDPPKGAEYVLRGTLTVINLSFQRKGS